MPIIFTCSLCQATYPAIIIEHGNNADPAPLKAAWYKAMDKLDAPNLRPEQMKAAAVAEVKACGEYLETVKWQETKIPAEITFKAGRWICASSCKETKQ